MRFQGVEAQTVANAYAAMEHDLKIIPVINKIDLSHARTDEGGGRDAAVSGHRSRRSDQGQRQSGARHRTAAAGDRRTDSSARRQLIASLQAMVFDSHYDDFRGAITYIRVMNGTLKKGDKVRMLRGGTNHEVLEVGRFSPQRTACPMLGAAAKWDISSATSSR